MAFRLNEQDVEVLTSIAEYRVLGIRHLTVLHQRNAQALRRRLRILEKEGLIRIDTQGFGKIRGRPASLVSLTERGVGLLKTRKVINRNITSGYVTAEKIRCLDHHLLAHDFRLQLVRMERLIPDLNLHFLSPLSPMLSRSPDDRALMHEKIRHENLLADWVEFTPDGVFSLTRAELGKTLLFFLEVDMGTETVVSPRGDRKDIQQKIVNYQTYFHLKRYKRYERIFDCALRGFRLLFLTHSRSRMTTLCRLVRDTPPSDFIWLVDRGNLMSEGAGSAIWAQGGRIDMPPQSLLSSRMPEPTPKPLPLT